jgi:hypothetical protein
MARKVTSMRIDQDLLEKVKTQLLDPVTGRTKYGALQALIESLLWKWLRDQSIPSQQKEPTQ